ncbi:MAG: serine/threonine-protein kinase [Phycisphaerae bacterium]
MSLERLVRAEAIVHRLLQLAPESRDDFVRAKCGADDALLREVHFLLESRYSSAGTTLGGRATAEPADASSGAAPLNGATVSLRDPRATAARGVGAPPVDAIPGYAIESEIHRGGQGVVYLATQHSTRRKVAIKVLREGPFAGVADEARFEREVRVLAQLQHPNIVSIHDSGRTRGGAGGLFYFVMDFIAGEPLDAYVARLPGQPAGRPPLRAVLELFAVICDAVHAAHLRGVIHRDLKPGNIRVGTDGRPHVLDFGLAKVTASHGAIDAADERGAALTQSGQFMGSLPWASPEQAEGAPDRIDVRSDVYSLGVILYQLLAGAFPYPVAGPLRAVLNHISQTAPVPLSKPRPGIDSDVETIVHKCLSKERERRYDGAGELAREVRRVLAGEPIDARRDSTWYVLRRQVRRHRAAVTVAGLILLLLSGFAVLMSIQSARNAKLAADNILLAQSERRAADEATAQRKSADQVTDVMSDMLGGIRPAVARDLDTALLRQLLDNAAERIRSGELANSPAAELRLRLTIGDAYRQLMAMEPAAELLSGAEALARRLHPGDHALVAEALSMRAILLHETGHTADGLKLHEECLAMRRRLRAGDDPSVARSLANVAFCREMLGEYAPALEQFQAALAMQQRLYPGDHEYLATGINNVGACLEALGRQNEAIDYYERALAMRRRLLKDPSDAVAQTLSNIGTCLVAAGRPLDGLKASREALDIRRRIFHRDHQDLADSINNVAFCLDEAGRPDEALTFYRDALAMYRRMHKTDHASIAMGLNNVALCLRSLDKPGEALPLLEESLAMYRRLYPGAHPRVALAMNNIGFCLSALKRTAEGLTFYQSALAMFRTLHTGEHPDVALGLANVGSALRELDRPNEALPMLDEALTMYRRLYPKGNSNIAVMQNNLAACYKDLKRPDEALEHYDASIAAWQALFPDGHPRTADAMDSAGLFLESLGRNVDALQRYEAAWALRQRVLKADHPDLARSEENIAYSLRALKKPDQALRRFESVLARYDRLKLGDHGRVVRTLNNIGTCLNDLGRTRAAVTRFEEALAMRRRIDPAENPGLAVDVETIAECYDRLNDYDAALRGYEESLAIRRRVANVTPAELGLSLMRTGRTLVRLKRFADAEPLLREAVEAFGRGEKPSPLAIGMSKLWLSEALLGGQQFAEADRLARAALEQAGAEPAQATLRRELLDLLARVQTAWDASDPHGDHAAQAAEFRRQLQAASPTSATAPAER